VQELVRECDEAWFGRLKQDSLKNFVTHAGAFLDLKIPAWQKMVCMVYVAEVLVKKSLTINRERALGNLS
jgi:hypothetical protein